MRKRKWALFAFILLIAFIFTSLESWRLAKANEKLKRYILTEFRPILGDQLHISTVHLSFGNIHIRGVDYPLPDNRSSVHIKDLRLGYNFFNLMLRGFDLRYISQDVLFDEPTFSLNAALDTVLIDNREMQASQIAVLSHLPIESQLKELDLFKHITLKEGKIVYSENDSASITLVHSLQGGIFRNAGDSAFIHLDGAFLNSDEQNVQIIGKGSMQSGTPAELEASFFDYDLEKGMPFIEKQVVDLLQGRVAGSIFIKQNEDRDAYEISGKFTIEDGAANFLDNNIMLENLQSDMTLAGGALHITRANFEVNGSPATMSGDILNIRKPDFNLNITSDSSKCSSIVRAFSQDMADKIDGPASFHVTVQGPVDSIKINGRLFSAAMETPGIRFKSLAARFEYDQHKMTIKNLSATSLGADMRLAGMIDFSTHPKPKIEGVFSAVGRAEPYLAFLHIDSSVAAPARITAKIAGSLNEPLILGSLSASLLSAFSDTLTLDAALSYYNKRLTIEPISTADNMAVEGRIDWHKSPVTFALKVGNVEHLLSSLWRLPPQLANQNKFGLSMALQGSLKKMALLINVKQQLDGGGQKRIFQSSTTLEKFSDRLRSSGAFVIQPSSPFAANGDFKFVVTNKSMTLQRFRIGDNLSASFSANLDGSQELSGTLEAKSFNLPPLLGVADSSITGQANIKLVLLGTIESPFVDGYINLHNARYHKLGAYDLYAYFNVDRDIIHVQHFLLNQHDATLLYAQGMYDASYDSLNMSIKGAGFDIGGIYALGAEEKPLVSGKTFVDVHVAGALAGPQISGILAVKNGMIYKFPFDEMELQLGDSTETPTGMTRPRLHIDQFRLTRFDDYEILGSGKVPFSAGDSLSLNIDGKGNFLRLLGDLSDYFQNPGSDCRVTGRIRGTPAEPRLQAAHLSLRGAGMEFKSVVPPISNVNGDLTLDVGRKFIHLDSLNGLMGGKKFHIYNEPVSEIVADAPLKNMHIGDSEVHLGVLILTTPDGGVPLNFVGLMQPKDFARLDLLGKKPNEKFYFGAVDDALTLRGRINISGGKIMYPFYDGGHASPKVQEFLENLRWDLFVSPESNTRFVRSFPGGIDEIYVDLKLDDNYGGLEFSGKNADESFRINGQVRSTKGFLEYLDLTFRVDQVGIEFDRGSLMPVAYGRAKTTVTDSLGIPSNIYLTMQTVDNTMDKKAVDDIVREEKGRARFNRIRFKLSSDNPNIGVSEAQIMATLGYSANNFQNSALGAIGFGTDNLILRPLFRPVEKGLEQKLGFDYVRFSSQLTKNIILFNLNDNLALNSRLALLQSTKVMVGKYLADRFFLQYTGQIESGVGYRYKQKDLGFHHTLGLEFQINPQLLMELEYDYDSLMLYNRDDKRIIVRHWFPF